MVSQEAQSLIEQLRSPISPADLELVDDALAVADELPTAIARMKAAGLDVSAIEQESERAAAQLRTIKQVYGPNQPTP
jgi:hypothetical protein